MSFQTPNRSTTRPALPTLPATPESNVLSSPVASFSSPTPNYWGTPAGGLWPSTSSYMTSNSSDISTSTPARGHDTDSVNDSFNILNKNNSAQDSGKRGRPRADVISHLILEGSSSPSGIKCRVCNRVFPREKSLQAHLRTHTGERPYQCDYPGCTRAFTQSGQLKTHQRLHAGEKPFVCSSPGCGNRYTHANRTCPAHPYHKPQRSNDLVLQPNIGAGENADDVQKWLECYRRERMDKTPAKNPNSSSSIHDLTPVSPTIPTLDLGVRTSAEILAQELCKRNRIKRGLVTELEQENHMIPFKLSSNTSNNTNINIKRSSPMKPGLNLVQPRKTLGDITPKKDKNILSPEPINNHVNIVTQVPRSPIRSSLGMIPKSPIRSSLGMIPKSPIRSSRMVPKSPIRSLNPKKRWMKTVVQEQKQNHHHVTTTTNVLHQEKPAMVIHVNSIGASSSNTTTSSNSNTHPDEENLAMPISWNENESPLPLIRRAGGLDRRNTSPVHWSVVSALVDLSQSATPQPLNLSTSGNRRT